MGARTSQCKSTRVRAACSEAVTTAAAERRRLPASRARTDSAEPSGPTAAGDAPVAAAGGGKGGRPGTVTKRRADVTGSSEAAAHATACAAQLGDQTTTRGWATARMRNAVTAAAAAGVGDRGSAAPSALAGLRSIRSDSQPSAAGPSLRPPPPPQPSADAAADAQIPFSSAAAYDALPSPSAGDASPRRPPDEQLNRTWRGAPSTASAEPAATRGRDAGVPAVAGAAAAAAAAARRSSTQMSRTSTPRERDAGRKS